MAVTGLLARGWFRGRLGGWLGTSIVLALTLTLMVLVSALFAGMQAETEERVGAVFTGEARVTPITAGVLGPGAFTGASILADEMGDVTMRMEAQSVLSRRGFLEAIIEEDEQFTLTTPGTKGDTDTVALGVLVGVPFQDPDAARWYEPYLREGSLPTTWDGEGPIPIVISLQRLEGFVTDEEVDEILADGGRWPPRMQDVRALPFEITAAVRDPDGDVIRHKAVLSGYYSTGVDTLDAFTQWAPIGATRYLLGYNTTDDVANVFIAEPGASDEVSQAAAAREFPVESQGKFTERYLGQLILALRTLATITSAVLFAIPAFLVAHGVERVLEQHKREVGVLRAIGVPGRSIRAALARLVTTTMLIAIIIGTLIVWPTYLVAHAVLPVWDGAPVPLDLLITRTSILAGVGVAVGSVLVAFAIAVSGQRRADLATLLRHV